MFILRGNRSLTRRFCLAAGCSLPAFVAIAAFHVQAARELAALRQDFPLQSLRERLDYEHRPVSNVSFDSLMPVNLSPLVDKNLTKLEEAERRSHRRRQLREIHEWTATDFVEAQGFGVMRTLPPRKDRIQRPPLEDLPFSGSPPKEFFGWQGFRRAPVDQRFIGCTGLITFDFLDADGLGFVQAGPRAAGFIPHASHYEPAQMMGSSDKAIADSYRVDRVELVSLLKHERPFVYVTDRLPRMDRLSADDVPLRELDTFETDALLNLLRTQQDIVTQEDRDGIRMFGRSGLPGSVSTATTSSGVSCWVPSLT